LGFRLQGLVLGGLGFRGQDLRNTESALAMTPPSAATAAALPFPPPATPPLAAAVSPICALAAAVSVIAIPVVDLHRTPAATRFHPLLAVAAGRLAVRQCTHAPPVSAAHDGSSPPPPPARALIVGPPCIVVGAAAEELCAARATLSSFPRARLDAARCRHAMSLATLAAAIAISPVTFSPRPLAHPLFAFPFSERGVPTRKDI